MAQPGFMIYSADWRAIAEDYSAEEVGSVFIALLKYFDDGLYTEFNERGLRVFYRQAVKGVDLDAKRYAQRCVQNAYNRYRGLCKKEGKEPLSVDDWYNEIYLTTVDDRKRPLTKTTNTNTNDQLSMSTTNDQLSESIFNNQLLTSDERGVRGENELVRLTENEFEAKRDAALRALENYKC